jgi:hypothetical protein
MEVSGCPAAASQAYYPTTSIADQVSSSAATFLVEPEVWRAIGSKWSPGWTSTTPVPMLCTPASRSPSTATRSDDDHWPPGRRRYPIIKVTTPVPVEGGVAGGALPMSAGSSFHAQEAERIGAPAPRHGGGPG